MKELRKRLLTTAIVTAILLTVLGGFAASADTALELMNASFESGESGWGSSATGGLLPTGSSIVTGGAPDGDNYLSMTATNVYVYSSPVEVMAGEEYFVTCRYKASASGGHAMYIYFYDEENTKLGGTITKWTSNTNNNWTIVSSSFTAPTGAVTAIIVPRSVASDANLGWDKFAFIHVEVSYDNILSNGNMETVSGGVPEGWSFNGGATVTNYSADTTDKNDGTYSLKITNSDTGSITASADCYTSIASSKYEVSAYFNLVDLASGADGAKLSVYNKATSAEIASTSYFKLTGKGWRKMLVVVPTGTNVTEIEIRLILSGAGTVYLDDVSVQASDEILMNGDFEGLSADGKPSSNASLNMLNSASNPWTDTSTVRINTEDGNNYLNLSGSSMLGLQLYGISLSAGTLYKISFDYKGKGWGPALGGSVTGNIVGLLPASPNNGSDWTYNYEYYFTVSTTGATHNIGLYSRDGKTTACFDNIKVEAADTTERLEFYKNGERVTGVTAGSIVGKYTGFADDYTVGGKTVTLFVALYKKEGYVLNLMDVKISTGAAKNIPLSASSANYIQNSPQGKAPLILAGTVTVPGEGGAYVVKTFAWDGTNTIMPYLTSEDIEGTIQ